MSFPTSPTNGQTTTLNGITYIYNVANNAWKRQALTSLTIGNITANTGLITNFSTGNAVITGGYINNAANITTTGNLTTANVSLTGNITFADNSILRTALIYDLDEMYPDGTTNTFVPRYNQSQVTISNPWNLLITINGIFQPAYTENSDTVWLSSTLCASRGYTVSSGNIKFADTPPAGSTILARTQPGSTQSTTKIYPFRPVDIMLGYE
jgi:hypothetical protein